MLLGHCAKQTVMEKSEDNRCGDVFAKSLKASSNSCKYNFSSTHQRTTTISSATEIIVIVIILLIFSGIGESFSVQLQLKRSIHGSIILNKGVDWREEKETSLKP